jgi:uncharacterized coiled-coil protein SlyX
MQNNRSDTDRLKDLEDELATVKEELTALGIKIDEGFENQGDKLDKILSVLLKKEKIVNDRLHDLEHHTTHPPIVQ